MAVELLLIFPPREGEEEEGQGEGLKVGQEEGAGECTGVGH